MGSRQERRRAERDAAKRAPAKTGATRAAGAAGAAAALANLNVNGDWTTQTEDPHVLINALGPRSLKQKAAEGDRAAQYSLGFHLVSGAGGYTGKVPGGAACRTAEAEVGLEGCTSKFSALTRLM